jgi:hypothetical protein
MGRYDMFFWGDLAKTERAGMSDYELICWQLTRREILGSWKAGELVNGHMRPFDHFGQET